jgi:hypothetical protein
MIGKLSVLILAATLLAGCMAREAYPRQSTTMTTTTGCSFSAMGCVGERYANHRRLDPWPARSFPNDC